MIIIKTSEEIEIMREGGKILSEVLQIVAKMAKKPGVFTEDLNKKAEEEILKRGAMPSFKDYIPEDGEDLKYPASLCVSVNDAIVHGIPDKKTKIQAGDVIGLDLGVEFKGLYSDAAITVICEEKGLFGRKKVISKYLKLVETAEKCLFEAIKVAKSGNTIGDIGWAIQITAENEGFSVVRDLVGHGVGKFVHEAPEIPNFGIRGKGLKLKEGMTLAIEPMICAGRLETKILADGWTVVTKDGSYAAHFEHTIVITKNGGEILTK
ncbi:MAG: type I methionyl aminopeptidase [bacterium]